MCGLVGSLHLDSAGVADPELIIGMRDSLTHRGPDDCGMLIQGRIGLGFRRLSVIDISGGHQPMVDDATGVSLVFNGEIYNYRELRRELETLGQQFRTKSDTEVVLKSYCQWGSESVTRFIGQFAFAIWDPRSEDLFLTRDRLGIKPLFWTRVDNEILFASETKAFFAHPEFHAEADLDAVSSYLTFRQAVWDICFFRGLHKVLPGHFVTISSRGVTDRVYWELPVAHPDESLDESTYLQRVEKLVTQATRRCMISDVPVGAYLSGGLDSSILVAILSQHSTDQLHTFSIGYEEHDYDEGQYAREVANYFKTRHLHIVFPRRDYQQDWLKLLRLRDVPLSIPHEIPLYHLSVELKRFVTVAISGEGADELFGGYGRVLRSPMDWRKLEIARSILGSSFSARLGASPALRRTTLGWLRSRSLMEHFFRVYSWMPFEEKWSLMSGDVLQAIDQDARTVNVFEQIFSNVGEADPYDRIFHVFQKIHLGCLLDRLDGISMAASVEGRVPFVDHELIEFVINMPLRYKLRWKSPLSRLRAVTNSAARASEWLDTNKYLLRRFGRRLLPKRISERKKLGFPTPLDDWLRDGLMDSARDLLLDKTTRERGVFDHQALARMLATAQDLPHDLYGKKIWMLMNVELWFREFIDAQPRERTAQAPYTVRAA